MRIAGFDSAWTCSLGSDEPGRSAVSVRKRQQPASCCHPINFGFGHIAAAGKPAANDSSRCKAVDPAPRTEMPRQLESLPEEPVRR